ncbi:pericentrin isoform X3 [Stomoxys calcitrans]|uniref:pericentrin isoform X3 n=1 Tax=Stomoxys calcitrans TaxID=35570 RepID=UPI0027E23F89|nr:pericentrin isoform X3 [Stomoxys calcitrans]
MDFFAVYDWITSLLRPRATYKTTPIPAATTSSVTLHPYLGSANANNQSDDIVVYAAAATPAVEESSSNDQEESSKIDNVELIPTLEFVNQPTPSPPKTPSQHSQQCSPLSEVEQQPQQRQQDSLIPTLFQQHESATSPPLTFTVSQPTEENADVSSESSAASAAGAAAPEKEQQKNDSLSSLDDTSELLRQEVELISLTSVSTYFDEPTSSISIEMMDQGSHPTNSERATTTYTTTSVSATASVSMTPSSGGGSDTRNPSVSHSYVPQQFLTHTPSSLSEERESDEIEEEIEEALEISSEEGPVESLDIKAGGSTKPPSQSLNHDQMFGIEFSDNSSLEISGGKLLITSGKSLKSSSNDDQFKIDEDQLSGGKLAQHFVLVDDDEEEEESGLAPAKPDMPSLPNDSEHSIEHEQSLSNQSTSHDVSELQEESKADIDLEDSLLTDGDCHISLPEGNSRKSINLEEVDSAQSSLQIPMLDIPQGDHEKLESFDMGKLSATPQGGLKLLDTAESLRSSGPTMPSIPLSSISLGQEQSLLLSGTSPGVEQDIKRSLTKATLPELFENPNIKPLSGASSMYSEKDQSMEEIMDSNHSLQMTFDENLSSLNPSFLANNETLVNELLKDNQATSQKSHEGPDARLDSLNPKDLLADNQVASQKSPDSRLSSLKPKDLLEQNQGTSQKSSDVRLSSLNPKELLESGLSEKLVQSLSDKALLHPSSVSKDESKDLNFSEITKQWPDEEPSKQISVDKTPPSLSNEFSQSYLGKSRKSPIAKDSQESTLDPNIFADVETSSHNLSTNLEKSVKSPSEQNSRLSFLNSNKDSMVRDSGENILGKFWKSPEEQSSSLTSLNFGKDPLARDTGASVPGKSSIFSVQKLSALDTRLFAKNETSLQENSRKSPEEQSSRLSPLHSGFVGTKDTTIGDMVENTPGKSRKSPDEKVSHLSPMDPSLCPNEEKSLNPPEEKVSQPCSWDPSFSAKYNQDLLESSEKSIKSSGKSSLDPSFVANKENIPEKSRKTPDIQDCKLSSLNTSLRGKNESLVPDFPESMETSKKSSKEKITQLSPLDPNFFAKNESSSHDSLENTGKSGENTKFGSTQDLLNISEKFGSLSNENASKESSLDPSFLAASEKSQKSPDQKISKLSYFDAKTETFTHNLLDNTRSSPSSPDKKATKESSLDPSFCAKQETSSHDLIANPEKSRASPEIHGVKLSPLNPELLRSSPEKSRKSPDIEDSSLNNQTKVECNEGMQLQDPYVVTRTPVLPKPLSLELLAAEEAVTSFREIIPQQLEPSEQDLHYATENFVIPDFQQIETCGNLTMQQNPNKDIITDLDDSLQENEEKPMSSTNTQENVENFTQPLHVQTTQDEEDVDDDEEEEEDTSLQLMKLRIMAMKHQPKESQLSPTAEGAAQPLDGANQQNAKPMERVALLEFAKDVLEDITEESERNSLSTQEEQQSLNLDKISLTALASKLEARAVQHENESTSTSNSIVSVNMVQMLEQKVGELQQMLASKDACLASLNMQLENMNRRESIEQLGSVSGRDTSSLVTNSTEYRTLQEDFGQGTMDIYMELTKRDELIAKLTDSLQQSLTIRENLQTESEKMSTEVQLLRKQLTDAMETLKRPCWPRVDQESNFGQRISEISMDLISESDDDFDRHYFTDTEEKFSRNSRERQLSMPRQFEYSANEPEVVSTPFSKQIEQFQKYLTPSEVRLFFMVQKKFDDYLCQELEKSKMKNDQEMKIVMDQWDTEKREKDEEIQRLLQLRQEREVKHNQEMENLRKYFETKCADLEKQFSDDVFSQKSQRQGMSSSESSDQEQLSLDYKSPSLPRSKETSPRKRFRAELLLSPSHRQMTPSNDAYNEEGQTNEGSQLALEITELKTFYQNKIHEIQRSQEENIKKLSDRLKYYETRYPEDEFMQSSSKNSTFNTTRDSSTNTEDVTQQTVRNISQSHDTCPPEASSSASCLKDLVSEQSESSKPDAAITDITNTITSPLAQTNNDSNSNNHNTSLIIIDTDELNSNNETQIIQKIIEEYERRLQEQLALAREDIVHELEQQIQTLLSESTADDQHWPKELILLREKFTAKSQLEIAQLQIKHADEMSRLKQDYEKQLNRKNKRNSTFDSLREYDKLLGERDNLRELSNAFRQVLAELLKCVANCENDLNDALVEEVQRLLSCNRTLEEHASEDFNLSTTLLNETLNTTRMRLMPDVHTLMEVVEDPCLVQYITQKNNDNSEDFDLKDCLECLRSEASYLLHLSEDLVKKHNESNERKDSYSSEREKNDSEQEDGLKLQQNRKFIRVNSLNEQQLPTHRSSLIQQQAQNLTSLPPDLNRLYQDNWSSTTAGGVNAVELHFQLTELKNRLIKSENDRLHLQQELDLTISRNSDLGQELQHLRDQLSQLSSLNNVEYNEGYGLGTTIKSPPRLSGSDNSSTGFAQLQEKARNILSTPTQKQQNNDSTVQLLQMIEDFCREGDKVVECSKKDREDLQSQIDTADKQLKATRQFLEEQAIEREQERDEFLKEIDNLKAQLRDKEKERSSYANASEEVEHLESQIRELTQNLQESNGKRDKFEVELKASIDKIFVLREIISDLETQVETKALNEHVMGEKVKQLEEYLNSQSHSNEALQMEVQSLKGEIEHGYQTRINQLEEKLQNIRPPAEQSLIMDQVVEQLRDIESTLEQKTKMLESLHQSNSSSVGSLSCPEDVSARGVGPTSLPINVETPPQGSPVHPSPRQHSWTMEGVQRVVDKLSKHSRVEEAAVKRIRDLEMQVNQMRTACVYERESLQERMSEQTQRISALQSRLEEQRQRAEELQRANTSDLNIRIHDLQNELQTVRETLSNRDKQIATMKQQLEKSKTAIDRLEAELAVEHQPDRSAIERLESELKLKQVENQKLKDKIKNEMINKLALPDLMETMLADKNEEIDHLKEQLECKEKELQTAFVNITHSSSLTMDKKPEDLGKLSARTLSDIVSISEFDEPDVVRRAVTANTSSPLLLPAGSGGFLQNTMDTSKGAVANLTHKRTEDLTGFATTLHQANTFDNPYYFQDPNLLLGSAQSGATATPTLVPRQINFSEFTDDSKLKTPGQFQTPEQKPEADKLTREALEKKVDELQKIADSLQKEKNQNSDDLISSQLRLNGLQDELQRCQKELEEFKLNAEKIKQLEAQLTDKSLEIEQLLRDQDKWQKEKSELLSKNEKNFKNLQESEENYKHRIQELEENMLKNTEKEFKEKESLRKELRAISEVHEQCKFTAKDNENRKKEIENLNQEIKAKDERLLSLSTKLSIAEEKVSDLQRQIVNLEREVEKWKQQSSDNSSRQFSVDEIAQQVEKELNYSAQLDSNILKAIESEEENNLDRSHIDKKVGIDAPGTTDDENFIGERDLLNQLEALRAQIAVEREHAEELRKELLDEKQHSQEVQEQDVVIIEAMRKRLESALAQEDELHKHLDIEREKCERLQTQLTTLQRTESRRNSSLLKSPTESPRKSPRSLTDFESELADRLRSEIKLLTAQNERERERSADLQRNSERERSRYEKELSERIEYCDKLKREMEKVARDKDNAEQEIDHLQERLVLQTQEIESLEARIGSLQAAETRRFTRKDQHQKENAQLMAEMQELKNQLQVLEAERDSLNKTITQLRYDIERSAQRESKLAEALANANAQLAAREGTTSVPEQFLQKMKEINTLLAENTQENKQMAETVQYLVEERRQLQRKCEELEAQLNGSANVAELEERCNHLLGRYLRVESHRKALVYQKRYLKVSLQNYQDSEQRALAAFNGGHLLQQPKPKKKLFKTVALAIIAIQRMKYIGRIWHTGKRIVSKSVFTITQQKRSQAPTISSPIITSSSQQAGENMTNGRLSPHIYNPMRSLERPVAPLKTPTLLNGGNKTPLSAASTASGGGGGGTTAFEWPKVANKAKKI